MTLIQVKVLYLRGKLGKPHREIALELGETEINLRRILEGSGLTTEKKLDLILDILHALEKYIVMVTDEANDYHNRLKNVSSVKTEFDIKEIQEKFISAGLMKSVS